MVCDSNRMEDQGLKEALGKLELSKEETQKFEKAFKDPKFMEMFAEYAREISDPKNREETDMYLRQLEEESRVEEVYGKGVQLIIPTEGFVAKTRVKGTGRKVFINVCHSDKVEPCKASRATDPSSGSSGTSWEIPLSLAKPKAGKDNRGDPCDVYDFVVHPNTKEMAVRSARFKAMVVETAMEHVERNFGVKLDRSWKQPRMAYKGVEGAEKPHAMAVRSGGGSDGGGRVRPSPDAPEKETRHAVGSSAEVAGGGKAAESPLQPRSAFAFPAAKKRAGAEKPGKPGDIGYRYPTGEVCPSYQLIERGSLDLAAAWGDAGRGIDVGTGVPAALVLRVDLPGCKTAAGLEVDVDSRNLVLQLPGKFRLEKKLVHDVDETKSKARFNKTRQRLEVTLPVVPPAPRPPRRAAAEAQPPRGGALVQEVAPALGAPSEEGEGGREASCGSEGAAPAREGGPGAHERVTGSGESGNGEKASAESETKRRWAELMERHDQQQAAAERASGGEAARAEGPTRQPEGSEEGRQAAPEAALGGHSKERAASALAAAGICPPAAAPEAPPVSVTLRPRLNLSLAEDLD